APPGPRLYDPAALARILPKVRAVSCCPGNAPETTEPAMLDTLRSGAKSWISKLLIGLLVISFAIWGISGDLLNVGGDQVATVGDRKISIVDFDNAYRRELDTIGRNIGRPLSTVEGASLGIPAQVLGRLIAEAALNETADQYNLGVS